MSTTIFLNRRSINMVVKKQIASTIKEESQNITIHIQPVRHQSNVLDCVVLVIAFITSLLQGQHPAGATYNNQPLRPYLLECLTEGKMSVFPASNKDFQKTRCPPKEIMLNLFCYCHVPWSRRDAYNHHTQMTECDTSEEWYHCSCLNIPEQGFQKDCSWK